MPDGQRASFFDRLTGRDSRRRKAMSLYKRGMTKAHRHDHHGALASYSTMLEMADAPDDVRAMTLYNRALVYVATGEAQKGVVDLEAVLSMNGAPAQVKAKAREKLRRVDVRSK